MRQYRFLFLLLLLVGMWNTSTCLADDLGLTLHWDKKGSKYNYKGEEYVCMPFRFTMRNGNTKGNYVLEVSLWSDKSCQRPIYDCLSTECDRIIEVDGYETKGVQSVIERTTSGTAIVCDNKLTIFSSDLSRVHKILFRRKVLDEYAKKNSSDLLAASCQLYYKVTVYDKSKRIVRSPYFSNFKFNARTFYYSYVEAKSKVVDHVEADSSQDEFPAHPNEKTFGVDGDFFRVNYITSGRKPQLTDPIEVRLSFWFDANRRYPAYFQEDGEGLDQYNHAVVSAGGLGDNLITTNVIKRKRTDLNDFDIFVPSSVTAFADNKDAPCRKWITGSDTIYNDTIFIYTDIYKDGRLINEGRSYLSKRRFYVPEKAECVHSNMDTLKVWNVKREEISPTEVMVTYDMRLKCRDCGEVFEKYNQQRTEFIDAPAQKFCPPHLWNTLPDKFIGNREIMLPNGDKVCFQDHTMIRQCVLCGKKEPLDTTYIYSIPHECENNSDVPCPPHYWQLTTRVEYKNLPPENGCNRQLEITHHDGYCPGCGTTTKDVYEPTEKVNWDCCPPHDWKTISNSRHIENVVQHQRYHGLIVSEQRECTRCGLIETFYTREKKHHQYKLVGYKCTKVHPIMANVCVPFRMNMVTNDTDSTAFYIGETEVTQQLWNAVLPDNPHGWNNDSKMPANEITYEEVQTFITALNRKTVANNTPLQFRLPTAEEWQVAYRAGGIHIPAETRSVRPVAKGQADKIHCYDMLGNVAEMIDSCITATDECGEKVKWHGTMGGSSNELYDVVSSEIKWENLSERGMLSVGFRLAADYTPIVDENGNLHSDIEPQYIEEEVEATKQTGVTFIKIPIYRCEACEKDRNGRFYLRMKAYGVKTVGKDCNTMVK